MRAAKTKKISFRKEMAPINRMSLVAWSYILISKANSSALSSRFQILIFWLGKKVHNRTLRPKRSIFTSLGKNCSLMTHRSTQLMISHRIVLQLGFLNLKLKWKMILYRKACFRIEKCDKIWSRWLKKKPPSEKNEKFYCKKTLSKWKNTVKRR